MIESKGKAAARKYLYENILPGCFSSEKLRSEKILLLLGEGRELVQTDALGIKRQNIISIEKDAAKLKQQRKDNPSIVSYHGTAVDYLNKSLHKNKHLLFAHLDVEGTYLNQIDPAMSAVLRYAISSPQTLFATCSTIGRDTEVIWEGIKSLALFLWLARDETITFITKRSPFYRIAKFKDPLRMVIRDLFWLRSHLERSLVLSNSPTTCRRFFAREKALWDAVVTNWAMKAKDILRITESWTPVPNDPQNPRSFLDINFINHLLYRATHPWVQSVYLASYNSLPKPLTCSDWAEKMLKKFSSLPLIYFSKSGKMKIITKPHYEMGFTSLSKKSIWKRRNIIRYTPRELQAEQRTLKQIMSKKTINHVKQKEGLVVTQKKALIEKNGKLTEAGKSVVRNLAKNGLDIGRIMKSLQFPENQNTFNGVRSFVARAHRNKSCVSLLLTEKEQLVFHVIPDCAEKTAHGLRIRRIYPQVREMLEKMGSSASPTIIHSLLKKLLDCKVLTKILHNQMAGERIKADVYAFNPDLYGKVRLTKNKKAIRAKRKPSAHIAKAKKPAVKTAVLDISTSQLPTNLVAKALEKQAELNSRAAELNALIADRKKLEKLLGENEEKIKELLS